MNDAYYTQLQIVDVMTVAETSTDLGIPLSELLDLVECADDDFNLQPSTLICTIVNYKSEAVCDFAEYEHAKKWVCNA